MKYAIERTSIGGSETIEVGLSLHQALHNAAKQAAKNKGQIYQIYVVWYRESDGQHGYVNPDGNHSINGKPF